VCVALTGASLHLNRANISINYSFIFIFWLNLLLTSAAISHPPPPKRPTRSRTQRYLTTPSILFISNSRFSRILLLQPAPSTVSLLLISFRNIIQLYLFIIIKDSRIYLYFIILIFICFHYSLYEVLNC